jgi:hypothetical protein
MVTLLRDAKHSSISAGGAAAGVAVRDATTASRRV